MESGKNINGGKQDRLINFIKAYGVGAGVKVLTVRHTRAGVGTRPAIRHVY